MLNLPSSRTPDKPSSQPEPDQRPTDAELARRVEDFVDERREVAAMEQLLAADPRPAANEPAVRPYMAKFWLAKIRAAVLVAVEFIRSGGHRRG